jgi:thiol-disulfide isomerase/thioredoxin
MKLFFLFAFTLASYFTCLAKEDGYTITLNLTNNHAQKVYLCCYYGNSNKLLDVDSAMLTAENQTIVFRRVTKIFGGLYNLNFKNIAERDFIIYNENEFTINIDNNDVTKLTFIGSDENNDYQTLLNANEDKKELKKELFQKKHPTSIATKIMNVAYDIRQSILYHSTIEILKPTYLHDSRLIISPILDEALTQYIKGITQVPDSFNTAVDAVLSQLTCDEPMYKYVFKFYVKYITLHMSNGMDESYPYLVNKYIVNNTCKFLDSNATTVYKVQASNNVKMLLNKPSPNVVLKDKNGVEQNLLNESKKADYTLLAFFDEDCKHCKKRMPEMDQLADSLSKVYNLKIIKYSVLNANTSVEKWQAFFIENNINTNWIHTADFEKKGTHKQDFYAYSNPSFFLIDNKGILVGKEINKAGFERLAKMKSEESRKK